MKYSSLFLLGLALNLYAQGIGEFFTLLPDSAALNLSPEDRTQLLKNAKPKQDVNRAVQNQDPKLQLAVHDLDMANGFLGVAGNRFEGDFLMCYWNVSDGTKLVATYLVSYATFAEVEEFSFFRFQDGALRPIALREVIPDVEPLLFIGDASKVRTKLEELDYHATILYDLPRKGKSIIVRVDEDIDAVQAKKYLRGNRMELKWVDGRFEVGKVYWVQ